MSGMIGSSNKIKIGKKSGEGVDSVIGKFKEEFLAVIDKIVYFFQSPTSVVLMVIAIVVLVALYVGGAIALSTYFESDENYCIADIALETSDDLNKVNSEPDSFDLDSTYSYEEATQKASHTDLGIIYNGDNIKLNITGSWIPWFGDEKIHYYKDFLGNTQENKNNIDAINEYINLNNPNQFFLCNMTRVNLGGYGSDTKNIFGNNKYEDEFYYIKNYYNDVRVEEKQNSANNINLENKEYRMVYDILDSNYQQQCWLNRGMGLYMGFFSKTGKVQPNHFHHLAAQKAVCETPYFISESHISLYYGKTLSVNMDYPLIVKFDGTNDYKVSDFIKEYFTVSHYLERDNAYYEDNRYDETKIGDAKKEETILSGGESCAGGNRILCINKNEVVYNIRLHEDLLYKYGVRDPGMIIANAISMFQKSCYEDRTEKILDEEKGEEIKKTTRYFNSKFRFEETDELKFYKSYSDNNNGIKYDDGEVVKLVILDRYYKDNQGYYKLEFLSGFNLNDNVGSIESFLIDTEDYLIGTNEKRDNSLMYKIYKSIINRNTRTLFTTILCLFIIFNGFMIILGYKQFKSKEFMMFCFKIVIVFSFLNEESWKFFNNIFIDFFVSGTSGIINLIFDIFSKVFISYNPLNNMVFNYVSSETAGATTLSHNFKFLDSTFQFLFSKEMHLKIISLIYIFPIIGLIPVIFIYYLLFKYILILLGTVIPFFKNLLQITILLGLAPLFLLFIFFEKTNQFFKKWLNYLVSRMFEMIVFFFVLFFACGLVNNKFIDLLRYKACRENLADVFKDMWGTRE